MNAKQWYQRKWPLRPGSRRSAPVRRSPSSFSFSSNAPRSPVTMSFWEKKIKTYFTRIDYDKDGVITKKDFEGWSDSFGAKDAKRKDELKATLLKIWENLHEVTKSDSITLAQFIESFKKLKAENKLKAVIEGPLPLFFGVIDGNADGKIQKDEYELLFEIIKIDKKLAAPSFVAIDTDKDGNLTLDEFNAAGLEFFLGDDEKSPSQLFWGPLVA